mgnify:CR=1 FL=1
MNNINAAYNSSDRFSEFSKKYFNYLSKIQENINRDRDLEPDQPNEEYETDRCANGLDRAPNHHRPGVGR